MTVLDVLIIIAILILWVMMLWGVRALWDWHDRVLDRRYDHEQELIEYQKGRDGL